jgi:hypothetical protein
VKNKGLLFCLLLSGLSGMVSAQNALSDHLSDEVSHIRAYPPKKKSIASAARALSDEYEDDEIIELYESLAALKESIPMADFVAHYQPVYIALNDLRVELGSGAGMYSGPVKAGWESLVVALLKVEPHLKELTNWPDYEELSVDLRTMIKRLRRNLYT